MSPDFLRQVASNPINASILARWNALGLPDAWLVAGCLFQTVWNVKSGRKAGEGIKDYDIFYFEPSDLSEEAERAVQRSADELFGDLGVTVEVANQARVHVWYPEYFGRPYPQLSSAEEGIGRFLVLETCVGVRPDEVFAPYGLEGIYAGTLTPNPRTPYAELFAAKVASYRSRWDWLAKGCAGHAEDDA